MTFCEECQHSKSICEIGDDETCRCQINEAELISEYAEE